MKYNVAKNKIRKALIDTGYSDKELKLFNKCIDMDGIYDVLHELGFHHFDAYEFVCDCIIEYK